MAGVFEFTWDVYEGGYRWVETVQARALTQPTPLKPAIDHEAAGAEVRPQLFLTDGLPLTAGSFRARHYQPLHLHSSLFRTFAETVPTREGILAFADEYGPLGVGVPIELPPPGTSGIQTFGTGEPLSVWVGEILAFCQALTLWDMAREGDVAGLSRYIRWVGPDAVAYDSDPDRDPGAPPAGPLLHEQRWLATREIRPDVLERFRPGDLIQPALYQVQGVVNVHLGQRISPRLLANPQYTQLGLYFMPGSLIGALWLQFAQAIDGNKDYRRCRECQKWFELTPEVARTNRRFCSNACRSKAYRKRQAEARRCDGAGVPLESIAEQLGTDITTVRRWVARA